MNKELQIFSFEGLFGISNFIQICRELQKLSLKSKFEIYCTLLKLYYNLLLHRERRTLKLASPSRPNCTTFESRFRFESVTSIHINFWICDLHPDSGLNLSPWSRFSFESVTSNQIQLLDTGADHLVPTGTTWNHLVFLLTTFESVTSIQIQLLDVGPDHLVPTGTTWFQISTRLYQSLICDLCFHI